MKEKKFIKIPKSFFKNLEFKVKLPPHETTKKCFCYKCICRREREMAFLKSLIK